MAFQPAISVSANHGIGKWRRRRVCVAAERRVGGDVVRAKLMRDFREPRAYFNAAFSSSIEAIEYNCRDRTARTAELFLSLKGQHSLMVVEHDMHFIRAIAGEQGTVTVLADGSVLAEGTIDQVQADERVIEVYLGR